MRFGLATFLQESGGKAVGLQIFGQRSCQAWNWFMGKKCFKRCLKKEWDPSNIFQATFFRAQKLLGYVLIQPIISCKMVSSSRRSFCSQNGRVRSCSTVHHAWLEYDLSPLGMSHLLHGHFLHLLVGNQVFRSTKCWIYIIHI